MIYFHVSQKKGIDMAHKLNRKFYGKMLEWKRHLADRYALLVEGARRVGKTYLVTQFVESEYENFVDRGSVTCAWTMSGRSSTLSQTQERISVRISPGR